MQARVDVPVDAAHVVARGVAPVVDELEAAGTARALATTAHPAEQRVERFQAQPLERTQIVGA